MRSVLNARRTVSHLSCSTLGHLFWRCHLELAYSTYGNWQPLSNAPRICATLAWWCYMITCFGLMLTFHSSHEKPWLGVKACFGQLAPAVMGSGVVYWRIFMSAMGWCKRQQSRILLNIRSLFFIPDSTRAVFFNHTSVPWDNVSCAVKDSLNWSKKITTFHCWVSVVL